MQKKPQSEQLSQGNETNKEKTGLQQEAATLRRAGAMLLILVASMSAKSERTEPPKPEGLYVAQADFLPRASPYEEVALGELASPLGLGDTFDGAVSTLGYAVLFDRQIISKQLAADEIAILEQVEYGNEDGVEYKYISREIIGSQTIGGNDPQIGKEGFISRGSSGADLVSSSDNQAIAQATGRDIIGGGLNARSTLSPELSLTTYRRSAEDSYELVRQRTTDVSIDEEVDCDDDLIVTSEVVMTSEQVTELCRMIDEYDTLLPQGTWIAADYITHPDDAADAANDSVVQLSYPLPANANWPGGEKIDTTALHEVLHTVYRNLPKTAPARIRADKAYKMIVRNMMYEFPKSIPVPYEKGIGSIEPIWGILTESNYPDEHPKAGHPWDKPTEMVSSTITVVTYHPDEFLDKFAGLSDKQQRVVKSAIDASYTVFIAAGGDSERVMSAYTKVRSGMLDLMEK
jgi:hypothetical protein